MWLHQQNNGEAGNRFGKKPTGLFIAKKLLASAPLPIIPRLLIQCNQSNEYYKGSARSCQSHLWPEAFQTLCCLAITAYILADSSSDDATIVAASRSRSSRAAIEKRRSRKGTKLSNPVSVWDLASQKQIQDYFSVPLCSVIQTMTASKDSETAQATCQIPIFLRMRTKLHSSYLTILKE